jgi:hypothetical protein
VSPGRHPLQPILLTTLCRLSQARREELSLIGSQFWFLGLAVFAVSICDFSTFSIDECFSLQLVFESIPHMYVQSPCDSTSLLKRDTASPLSLPACSPLGGRRMDCGARRISLTACNTSSRIQARHAILIYWGRTSKRDSRFRCASRVCVSLPFLNPGLCSPDRRLGLELGCPLSFLIPLPASDQGTRLSRSPFAGFSLLTYVRFIVHILSGASVRQKTSCGCMRYGLVQHCPIAACFDVFSTVLSSGFGQHPVICFHPGQCDGTVGRSTS